MENFYCVKVNFDVTFPFSYKSRLSDRLRGLYNTYMKIIENKTFDEERALYNITGAEVINCSFAGPADGESALKECRDVVIEGCSFSLRYPLWHAVNFEVKNCTMDNLTRAALWYTKNGRIYSSTLGGIKALRECDDTYMEGCTVVSPEFGWRCRGVEMTDCDVQSEYFLFECNNIKLKGVSLKGKYSFQYVENAEIDDCEFDTKDAFWHAKNMVVRNTVLKGEYLGWYSDGLTLINCKISGTQPLCYCKNLRLINCTTDGCDLAFEYSDVEATIDGHIVSVKNPKSGSVTADSVGEVIDGDAAIPCFGKVYIRQKKCG